MLRRLLPLAPALALLATAALASPAHCFVAVTVLHWTATGDDGESGVAARYDVRRSTQLIDATNFALADTVGGVPTPAPSGTPQSCSVTLPAAGVPFYFAMRALDECGNWSPISNVVTFTAPVLDAGESSPRELAFAIPWPNPARERAALRLAIPGASDTDVSVFDAFGRRLRTLWDGPLVAGAHSFEWDLRDTRGQRVAGGVYFVRARCRSGIRVRSVIVTS